MAVKTLTPVLLAEGVASPDLVGADTDDTDVTTSDTFRIPMPAVQGGGESTFFLVVEELGGGAAVLTVDAGDYPPSARKFKGALTVNFATSDLKVLFLEPGRHLQDDGYITGSVSGQTLAMTAYYLQPGDSN